MVYPPMEEHKCSYRVYHRFAAMLSSKGVHVLRVECRGWGESSGGFGDFTAADWIEDIRRAVCFFREKVALEYLVLLGSRLSAVLVAAAGGGDGVVMWEPVLEPGRWLDAELRKQKMRNILVGLDTAPTHIEGYEVPVALRESIGRLTVPRIDVPLLAVFFGRRTNVRREAVLRGIAPTVDVRTVDTLPFWLRLGVSVPYPLFDVTLEWLESFFDARACRG